MPIEPTKKVFEVPHIAKKEDALKGQQYKKRKNPKKTEKRESGKIDIRI